MICSPVSKIVRNATFLQTVYLLLSPAAASSIQVPLFAPSSYQVFEDVLSPSASSVIDIEFKASEGDGVLFWNSDGGDFIGIGLMSARVVFTFDLGSGRYEI